MADTNKYYQAAVGFGQKNEWQLHKRKYHADGHLLMQTHHEIVEPFVYYSGSCCDKNKELKTFDKWQQYLKNFKNSIDHPLKIKIAD